MRCLGNSLTAGAVTLMLCSPAGAVDKHDVEKLSEALFTHMAVTYMCRDALGGLAHYQAARVIAINELSRFVTHSQAVDFVAKQDEQYRNDPTTTLKNANERKCLERVNEGLFEIEKWRAKTQ